ncbi:CotH kinase family protein [Flavobacteriales bacterium]|nr:CotH kinase family protein [Flavobacteriales bacterium]
MNFVTTNPMTNQANYNQAKSEYNMGSLIDYFLLNAYVVCQDWLNWNTGWWRGMDPNGDKKKWRYTLWDMDNTFDHGTNYTGIPSTAPTADPCDPSTLNDPGGQGHVPIWNEMLTNQEFHDDYINRWLDLANGPLSCSFMIHILDSMIAVIDPEMPRQITRWPGGTYAGWQSNVTDLRNWILARCDSMNSGFVDCDTAITGIYDVTIEIIGVGEVEMSNGNFINNLNTPFTDQRFGGIALPFEVKSGNLIYWEVIPSGVYIYDPLQDTLIIDLQGDVTVKAFFGESRNVVYDIVPNTTTTSIDINGVEINTFPHTETYLLADTITISPNIDPLYGFKEWSSDSVMLMPTPFNQVDSFYATNNDTIKLHLYLKPTIVYDVRPIGTTTTIDINGNTISVFPYSETCFIDEVIALSPNIDPLFGFSSWSSDSTIFINGNSMNNSFYGIYNDTIILNLTTITAGIYGNDTLCSNEDKEAQLSVYFTGIAPYTFTYTINGIIQPSITTSVNPYIINTGESGSYLLQFFSDANETGSVNGEAIVTILESPIANFDSQPDSMTILYTTTQCVDKSVGPIVSWQWDFGDNTPLDFTQNPYHTYPDSITTYQISLIISDNMGCTDTTYQQISITDDYWIYIPNSFTPDLDGKNDKYCIAYNGIREATFTFNVYNRFSELVYSTNNIQDLNCENGWDGKHQSTGIDLPIGAYIYNIYYQDFRGWKHQNISEIRIVR